LPGVCLPVSGDGGATAAAPERYMGERANLGDTYDRTTSSSSMLERRIKQDSANRASSGGGTRYWSEAGCALAQQPWLRMAG
jgi:hypothetical protein